MAALAAGNLHDGHGHVADLVGGKIRANFSM
jgi:hypothetical protein